METSGNRTALGVSADIAQLVGNRLRRARESIGRSTSALSAKIKVREHYLVAIEDGQWNELPPGLNGRGLVRIYARELAVSVPELDQAANPSVMPAEHDAQAPYQVTQKREHTLERDTIQVRTQSGTAAAPARASETTQRTNTLNSAQRVARAPDLSSPAEMMRKTTAAVGFKSIESTPEEEPLDVITPDVASILGITLETFEEAPKPRRAPEIPVQHAEPVHSDESHSKKSQKKQGKNKHESKNTNRGTQATPQNEEIPLVMPEAFVPQVEINAAVVAPEAMTSVASAVVNVSAEISTMAAPEPVPAAPVQAAPVQAAPVQAEPISAAAVPAPEVAPGIEEPVVANTVNAVQLAVEEQPSVVSSTATALDIPPSTPPGVSAAEEYLRSHSAQDSTESVPEQVASKGLSQPTRWAMGLVAASVVALFVGQVFMRPETPSTDAPTAESVSNESNQTASPAQPQDNPDTAAAPINTAPEAAQPAVDAAPAQPQNVEQLASTSAQPPSQTPPQTEAQAVSSDANKNPALASPSAAERQDASASESEEQDVASETTPPTAIATSGATAAVLTLSEPLEIQITADGKKVFSGKHNAGKVEIKFNKRAEIFVQDGSKARLKYAGWDHGTLGLAGRKRRIVLNAEKFAGSSN
ncbi:MAG: hypothetical protein RI932_291 [Pseudomonadota bacterium]|jgi:cytoskeletal protein RodZ